MFDFHLVKEIAEQVLSIPTIKGTPDRYLIDRAVRVLRHCGSIAQLNEVRCVQIDNECLNVAALFRDAGFARYANQGDQASRMVLADLTDADMRDFSTQVVQEKLTDVLNPRQMERVCSIIMESGSRSTRLVEAMILSDARNLEDMGAMGIFNELRRYVVHGRGATEALASWKRKIDYDYWVARLHESFRFEPVRRLAQQRMLVATEFMERLGQENRAADLEDILLEQHLGQTAPASRTERAGAEILAIDDVNLRPGRAGNGQKALQRFS